MATQPDLRYTIAVPIRESLKEVDANTWLIGPLILSRSSGHSDTATWFDEEDNSSYTITDAPNPQPPATLLTPSNPHVVQIYDAGDQSAIWAIGKKVVCKVRLVWPHDKDSTTEEVTLGWVQKKALDFQTPKVLHSSTHDHRTVLFLTRLPGRPLGDIWPSLSEERRQHYVKAIADICKSLENWKGDKISGIDGKNLNEPYLLPLGPRGGPEDFSPTNLQKAAEGLGIDCSSFVFYHANLDPGCIIVDDERIGIVDWEGAGYVPRGWIRTKYGLSPGMDLPENVDDRLWLRREVWKLLGTMGYKDHSREWGTWKGCGEGGWS